MKTAKATFNVLSPILAALYFFQFVVAPALHHHEICAPRDDCPGCLDEAENGNGAGPKTRCGGGIGGAQEIALRETRPEDEGRPCDNPDHPHHNHPRPHDHCPYTCVTCKSFTPHCQGFSIPIGVATHLVTDAIPGNYQRPVGSRFEICRSPRAPPLGA